MARIVTPQEAQDWLRARSEARAVGVHLAPIKIVDDLGHTVATEPDRISAAQRAAVVKVLREISASLDRVAYGWEIAGTNTASRVMRNRADAIENGADF